MMRGLAQSKNFAIEHECETVFLSMADKCVVIGDFYGDAQVAIIDKEEKWCAIGGHGLIIYWLEEPFVPFEENLPSLQYLLINRTEPKQSWWIDALTQIGPTEMEVQLDRGEKHRVSFDRTGQFFIARVRLPPNRFVLVRSFWFFLRLLVFKIRGNDFSDAALMLGSDWLNSPEPIAPPIKGEQRSSINLHIGFAATPSGRPVNVTVLASSGSGDADSAASVAVKNARVRAHKAGAVCLWVRLWWLADGSMGIARDLSDYQVNLPRAD